MKKIIAIFMLFSSVIKGQSQPDIHQIEVSLSSSNIQTAYSTPIDAGIPTPQTGQAIEIISASVFFIANTVPFTSSQIFLKVNSTLSPQYQSIGFLNGGINSFSSLKQYTSGGEDMNLMEKIYIQSDSDSPSGNGTATVFILYRIVGNSIYTPIQIRDTIVTLTSPQLLNIFTTPVTLIPSAGANNTIEVVSITDKLIYNTTAYTGHQTLIIKTATATDHIVATTVLNQSANCKHMAPVSAPVGLTQLLPNQPLIATTTSANPQNGDSSIELHIYYRIVPY